MDIAPGISVTSSLMSMMINAVIKASRKLLRDFSELENIKVSRKGTNDFVTSADLHSEKVIIGELQKFRPTYSILSEESGFTEGEEKDYCWIIDPLDGTINFMRGVPYWSISVALKKSNEIIAGVTYDPIRNEAFFAEKGKGAFVNNRRLKIGSVHYLSEALVAFAGVDSKIVSNIFSKCLSGRKMGSTALNIVYVASGRFDAFVRKGKITEWDTAAGILIANESGAVVYPTNSGSSLPNAIVVSGLDIADEFRKLVEVK